jgi:hypothetical protein
MNEKRRKSWPQRVVRILICLGTGWLVYAGVMNWMVWHFAREASRYRQNLSVVPTDLKDTTIGELKGPRIEKFGFSFQVPWSDIEHEKNTKSVSGLIFKDGAGLMVFDPADKVDGARIIRGKTAREQQLMNRVVGSQALSSNYELMAAELQSTPGEVKWWATRERNVRSLILLTNKAMDLGDAKVVYEIHSGTVRGFQYGDPNSPPYRVNLQLFDKADHHYEIVIAGKDKASPCVTQAQINGLVASFRGLLNGPVDFAPANGD